MDEPIHLFKGGKLDGFERPPWPAPPDHLSVPLLQRANSPAGVPLKLATRSLQ